MDLQSIQDGLSNCFQDVDLYFNDLSYMTPYVDFKTGKQLGAAPGAWVRWWHPWAWAGLQTSRALP